MMRVMTVIPGYMAVGLWFLFQLISGLGLLGGAAEGGVAYAHIGGFIAGAAVSPDHLRSDWAALRLSSVRGY